MWTGTGPTFVAAAYVSLIVRDHNDTTVVSQPTTFSVTGSQTEGTVLFSDDFNYQEPAYQALEANGWLLNSTSTVVNALQWANQGVLFLGEAYPQPSTEPTNPGPYPTAFSIAAIQLATPPDEVIKRVRYEFDYTSDGQYFEFFWGEESDTDSATTAASIAFNYYDNATGKDVPGQATITLPVSDDPTYQYGVTVFDAPAAAGHVVIDFTWNLNSETDGGIATSALLVTINGSTMIDLPSVTMSQPNYFVFYGAGNRTVTSPTTPYIAGIRNLVVYDTTPPNEALVITQASGYGEAVQLAGSNVGTLATAMDCLLDGGGAWQPVTSFESGATWTGQGPAVASGTHTIQVRDHNDTEITSNIETFTVGVGIFVWDGVTLH